MSGKPVAMETKRGEPREYQHIIRMWSPRFRPKILEEAEDGGRGEEGSVPRETRRQAEGPVWLAW